MPDFGPLEEMARRGRKLPEGRGYSGPQAVPVHRDFGRWVDEVADWLSSTFPESGLALEWVSLGESRLVNSYGYDDSPEAWHHFHRLLNERLQWLGTVPQKIAALSVTPERVQTAAMAAGRREVRLETTARAFVDPGRIDELRRLHPAGFDLTRLVRLCEELNLAYAAECYMATSMITRAVLDHVPPLFGCKSFREIANNYSGAKSFRESMHSLENSSRKIADQHLHVQIRSSEVLPKPTQVDCSNDFDVLLGEIVRVYKSTPPPQDGTR